ncbi:MAG TPA: response regulator [Myxococcales bacterium]|nr:response regulator [Myxococcales bacterium]
MRVLIVEDDADNGEILRELFEAEGLEVAWARTGQEAIDLLGPDRFGAALVDVSLPDLDGAAVLFALRRALPRAQLALVTGFPLATLDADLRRLADRIFEKPADPETLLAYVRAAGEARREGAVDASPPPA